MPALIGRIDEQQLFLVNISPDAIEAGRDVRGGRQRQKFQGVAGHMPYEEYFKSASESLIVVDRDGRIVEANPKTAEVFGYPIAELTGQPVEILLPTQLREAHRAHVTDFFAAPRTRVMGQGLNLSARRKDGSQFPVEISLTYARGTARGDLVVATVIDITERLALEQEARRAETIISLGTLAAGIAHDLNNPLQVIRSRAELLLEPPGATDAEMKEDLTVIHRQAERASRIVEEFLELSRYREKRRIPLNINRLIEKALMLIAEDLRRSGVAIRTELDRDLPEVNADATALERVLINLLMNARDAMADGGIVMIVTETPDGSPDWTHLKVADNGPGIRPEVLGKIFDLLYTTKSEGSGLGLWLSRRIIHEHNGKIEVKSELGKGTTFVIRLPAETPDS